MKMWLVGGSVAALLGVGFYLAASKRSEPAATLPAPEIAVVVHAPQPVATPVVLDRVVDVSDLDTLLDPPAIPVSEPRTDSGPVITRVGYEEPAPAKAVYATVPPIPKSQPDEPNVINLEEEITQTEETQPILYESGDGLVFPLPSWEDEFRNENVIRPRSIPLDTQPQNFLLQQGSFQEDPDKPLFKWDPLSSKDSELFKPASVVFHEIQEGTTRRDVVRRVYSLFQALNQVPASRLEWYTRWYGEQRLSLTFSDEAIAAGGPYRYTTFGIFFIHPGLFGGN